MIEREYVIYELATGKKEITIICKMKNSETLNTFLDSDVRIFEDWIKEDFDRVLSGKSAYEKVNGNVCYAEVEPQITKVYDNLIGDEQYYSTCCEVDTKELRQLIEEWCDKVREFKKETLS